MRGRESMRNGSASGNELCEKAGPDGFVSAADVSNEQRRRMAARGEASVFELPIAVRLGLSFLAFLATPRPPTEPT